MSEPKILQNRVASAFATVEPKAPANEGWASFPGVESLHSLEPDLDDEPVETEADRHSMLRYWLAGGGLLSSALVLAAGTGDGFMMVALFLGAIGVASLLYSIATSIESNLKRSTDPEAAATPPAASAPAARQSSDFAGVDMLASIHDALGDMTVTRTLQGIIIAANNTFREMIGVSKPEGRSCEELGIVFNPGAVQHCYDVEISRAGKARVFMWHDVVVRDPILGDLVVQSIARDVTDERSDTIRRELALERAEAESDLKSRLVAMVSHEIRTPLSGLLGMGQLLANTGLTPEQGNYLEGIRQSGTALAHLVEDLLDFSLLASGRFRLHPRPEALRPLIENVVEMLASRAHAKGIEIGAVVSPDLPEMIEIDPARLRQVLFNVIGNAVKFTEKGGVLVAAVVNNGMVEIRITDTGPGMKAAELNRIFGEFEQGDLTNARESGVGLGLAISSQIMTEAGGTLSVESEPGRGTTFTIAHPLKSTGRAMRSGVELTASNVLVLAPEGPAGTALVRALDRLGADVVHAASPEDAETELAAATFNGVIVDHRIDQAAAEALLRNPLLDGARKVYLVNPESRPATMTGNIYDSWLIRPLREQSLIDVLTGKLRGLEPRTAANDAFPVLAEVAEESSGETAVRPADALSKGLSILVGEDDPVNAMIAQAVLEKAGHRVRLADNFERLGALHAEDPANVILTDFSMPDGTSEAFIARLRAEEEEKASQSLPVIVLTADNTDETRRKLLLTGADLVLTKPAAPDILLGAIERLYEAKAA